MSTMTSEIYDAPRGAGASEEKARKTAEAMAGVDTRPRDLKHEFAIIKGEFNTMKGMLATNPTLTLLVLGKLFLR